MAITSKPKKLAVPEEPFYPIDTLYLFDRFDRASWERAFGEQAPPWDPSRGVKAWADTTAIEGADDPDGVFVEYDYFDPASRKFERMRMTAREAAVPNLPGEYVYPAYVVTPTPAVIINPDGGEDTFNPEMLCYRAEADGLARELGATSVIENRFPEGGQFRIEWRGEQRRMWLLRIGSNLHSAALLLQKKYRGGVGAPGEWMIEPSGQPVWLARKQETGLGNRQREVAVPCRHLADNEALYLGHPMKVVVYRTDMDSEYNRADPAAAGALPADIRVMIERIDTNLQQLLALSLTNSGR